MLRVRILLVAAALLAAGCIQQTTIETSSMRVEPVLVDDEGFLDGNIGRTWTWEVRPGYQTFRVCVMFEGAGNDAPLVVLPRVQLRHDHADGFAVHGRSEVFTASAPGCWFAFEQGDPGLWTLSLDAEGGRARWIAQVDVVY